MSVGFRAVRWNRQKLVYDAILIAGVALYITSYLIVANWLYPPKDQPAAIDLRIRAFGSCAFLLLSVILSIGPLARLDRRFLLLLYNRRHLGVLTFCVAMLHAWFMIEWYLVQNNLPNLAAELTKWADYQKFIGFPFKVFGIGALLILFLMAATSHDFWLAFLTPRVWKGLHMGVYFAYGLVVMHVSLGAMQDGGVVISAVLAVVAGKVIAMHLLADWRERSIDRGSGAGVEEWL